jgi:hypothetical protein
MVLDFDIGLNFLGYKWQELRELQEFRSYSMEADFRFVKWQKFRSCRSSGVAEWICGFPLCRWLRVLAICTRFRSGIIIFAAVDNCILQLLNSCNSCNSFHA